MRTGVLSDLAIKSAYPEYQPLNIGLSQVVESVVFDKHELVGVRLPKQYRPKNVPRFPINDLNNFSTLSSAPNKSKQVYTSVMGYRKKLGSSNIDTEERQTGRKLITAANEPVAFMSNNFELRVRGGVADKIKSSAVSQADIYANTKKVPHQSIIEANKAIRTEGAKMANVERLINMENLDNFTKATKTAQEKREIDYGEYLTSEFQRTNGGELYYNALTKNAYFEKRNPLKHAEGYTSKTIPMTFNVDLRTMEDMKKKGTAEYTPTNVALKEMDKIMEEMKKEIKSPPYAEQVDDMPELDTSVATNEEYSSKIKKPFEVSKNEKPMKQEDVDKMEAQTEYAPDVDVIPKSEASQRDPKRIPDNLAEFIKQREEEKMKNKNYETQEIDLLIKQGGYSQQKRIDKAELTPTAFNKLHKKKDYTGDEIVESSSLGQQLRDKRANVAQQYIDYYGNEVLPAQVAKQNKASHYYEERERAYQERLEYDADNDVAFGGNPFN